MLCSQDLEDIARAAGSAIMAIYQRDFEVFTKEDGSPLTEADLAAHHIIHEALAQRGGGIPILSEESSDDFSGADAQGQYWIVDPLDGTREFIKQNGEFTVNICLLYTSPSPRDRQKSRMPSSA